MTTADLLRPSLAGELDGAFRQEVKDVGLSSGDSRAMARTRRIDVPALGLAIEPRLAADRHGGTDLAGCMDMMRPRDNPSCGHIHAEAAGLFSLA